MKRRYMISDEQESEQALLLEEAYNLGYLKVKNGCLQEPLRKLNQLITTKEREAYDRGYADKSIYIETGELPKRS